MIIQTGNRTDIPAFYSKWFLNRIREGFVMTKNPFNPSQITRYSLDRRVVDLLVFCTKNPLPLLERIDELRDYRMFWFVTVTPYGRDIERNVPDKKTVLEGVRRLSSILGKERVQLRYDPVIITEEYSRERHVREFNEMIEYLDGYIDTCIISFVDLYTKVRRNWPELRAVTYQDRIYLTERFAEIARSHGILIKPCGEGAMYERIKGVDCSGCMTKEVFERAIDSRISLPALKPSRKECACFINADIGQYDTCMHLCRYCYANANEELVRKNYENHDPDSPLITGRVMDSDNITEAKQKSWIDNQLMFDIF